MQISLFEISYKKKETFSPYTDLFLEDLVVSVFYFSSTNCGEALKTSLCVCAAQSAISDFSLSLSPYV